jgi:hypothetical protein
MEDTRSSLNCCKDTATAALYKHLECLKKLHSQGVEWHPETTLYAAKINNLEILKYVHENGCPWHQDTIDEDCEIRSLEIIFYCLENKCPIWSFDFFEKINNNNRKTKNNKNNLLINIPLRKVVLHSRVKKDIMSFNPFRKLIPEYEEFINKVHKILELKTTLPTNIIKYEVMKYI